MSIDTCVETNQRFDKKAYDKAYHEANKEKIHAQETARRKANPEKIKAYQQLPSTIERQRIRRAAYWETNKLRLIQAKINRHHKDPRKALINSSRRRAKIRGCEMSITIDDIIIPTICPMLGIPLNIGIGIRSDNSASLDRIDSSKGYTKDNIQVISWRANRIKSDATLQELQNIVRYLEGNHNEQ